MNNVGAGYEHPEKFINISDKVTISFIIYVRTKKEQSRNVLSIFYSCAPTWSTVTSCRPLWFALLSTFISSLYEYDTDNVDTSTIVYCYRCDVRCTSVQVLDAWLLLYSYCRWLAWCCPEWCSAGAASSWTSRPARDALRCRSWRSTRPPRHSSTRSRAHSASSAGAPASRSSYACWTACWLWLVHFVRNLFALSKLLPWANDLLIIGDECDADDDEDDECTFYHTGSRVHATINWPSSILIPFLNLGFAWVIETPFIWKLSLLSIFCLSLFRTSGLSFSLRDFLYVFVIYR